MLLLFFFRFISLASPLLLTFPVSLATTSWRGLDSIHAILFSVSSLWIVDVCRVKSLWFDQKTFFLFFEFIEWTCAHVFCLRLLIRSPIDDRNDDNSRRYHKIPKNRYISFSLWSQPTERKNGFRFYSFSIILFNFCVFVRPFDRMRWLRTITGLLSESTIGNIFDGDAILVRKLIIDFFVVGKKDSSRSGQKTFRLPVIKRALDVSRFWEWITFEQRADWRLVVVIVSDRTVCTAVLAFGRRQSESGYWTWRIHVAVNLDLGTRWQCSLDGSRGGKLVQIIVLENALKLRRDSNWQ